MPLPSLEFFLLLVKIVVMATGLTGNAMVIIVVAVSKRLHSRVNALLVNLAVADLLSLLVCVPHSILDDMRTVYRPAIVCKLAFGLEHAFTMASSLTIVLIALERLLVICFPLRAPVLLAKRLLRTSAVALLWLVALAEPAPFFIGGRAAVDVDFSQAENGTELEPVTYYHCELPLPSDPNATMLFMPPAVYYTLSTVLELYLPMALIAILYTVILRSLLKSCNQLQGSDAQRRIQTNQTALKRRRRVVQVNCIVAAAYFLTTTPFRTIALCYCSAACFNALISGTDNGERAYLVTHLLRMLFYLNHCLNPIIYNLASDSFRTAFRRQFSKVCCCCCSCCDSSGSVTTGGPQRPAASDEPTSNGYRRVGIAGDSPEAAAAAAAALMLNNRQRTTCAIVNKRITS